MNETDARTHPFQIHNLVEFYEWARLARRHSGNIFTLSFYDNDVNFDVCCHFLRARARDRCGRHRVILPYYCHHSMLLYVCMEWMMCLSINILRMEFQRVYLLAPIITGRAMTTIVYTNLHTIRLMS